MILLTIFCVVAAPGQAAPPQFEVSTTGDKPLVGAIRQLDAAGSLTLQDGLPVTGAGLVALRRLALPQPSWPLGAQIVLHNGDRLAGTPVELTGALLHFRAAALQRVGDAKNDGALRIPLTAIAYLWWRSPESLERDRFAAFFADVRANDLAVLRNGDMIAGTLTGFDARQGELQFESSTERRTIALGKVAAVALSTKTARVRKPTGAYGHLVLTNGSRLTATSITIKEDALDATTVFRDPFRLALADLAALDIYQGQAVYLSDLKPAKFHYRTYQGEEYGWAADRNLERGELQLKTPIGVQTYDKGVSVHGECAISYALDAAYRRFECVVGLDARYGIRGNVDLQILVDGKEQKFGDGKPLNRDNGPLHLKIDVRGAKELTLRVNWGDGGNVGDYVNWCDARLIP